MGKTLRRKHDVEQKTHVMLLFIICGLILFFFSLVYKLIQYISRKKANQEQKHCLSMLYIVPFIFCCTYILRYLSFILTITTLLQHIKYKLKATEIINFEKEQFTVIDNFALNNKIFILWRKIVIHCSIYNNKKIKCP